MEMLKTIRREIDPLYDSDTMFLEKYLGWGNIKPLIPGFNSKSEREILEEVNELLENKELEIVMNFSNVVFNEDLIIKQKVNNIQKKRLELVYSKLDWFIGFVDKLSDDELEVSGKMLAAIMCEIENFLQLHWNFERDEKKHTYWNKFKKCTCPKMDNDERFGLDKIMSMKCPFHKIDYEN